MYDFKDYLKILMKLLNPDEKIDSKDIEACKKMIKDLIDGNNYGPISKRDMKLIIDSSDDAKIVLPMLVDYINTHDLNL